MAGSMGDAPVISVSDAVGLANATIRSIPRLVVRGEISGYRGPNRSSGHLYFQLKDDLSSMDVAVWRQVLSSWDPEVVRSLRDGLEVTLTGSFDIYKKSGKLSFIARKAEVSGEGLLRQQVAALARRLEAEGLMDPSRKRRVPAFCERVAVCTSLSGSVLDDVKRTLSRRNPLVELLVCNCSVQGPQAPQTIIRALEVAEGARPDCILLVRGGGSYEDLMAFNDEALARAVAASPVPVVTGIGHEPDTTICDMVSSRRCSTPTAAAESVAPAIDEVTSLMNARAHRLEDVMAKTLAKAGGDLDARQARALRAMESLIARRREAVEALARNRFLTDPTSIIDDHVNELRMTEQRLYDALPMAVARHRRRLDGDARRLASVGTRLVRPYRSEAESLGKTLRALSPLNVLGRGYAIVTTDAGHVVTDAGALAPGQGISVRLASGRVAATVTGTEKEPESQDGTAEPSSGAAGNDHGKDTDGVGDGATGKEKHGC